MSMIFNVCQYVIIYVDFVKLINQRTRWRSRRWWRRRNSSSLRGLACFTWLCDYVILQVINCRVIKCHQTVASKLTLEVDADTGGCCDAVVFTARRVSGSERMWSTNRCLVDTNFPAVAVRSYITTTHVVTIAKYTSPNATCFDLLRPPGEF